MQFALKYRFLTCFGSSQRCWRRCSSCRAGADGRALIQNPPAARKRVLAWADVRFGYQHDVISHALATIERLGYESGAFDTVIRTDSQPITKRPILFKTGTGIATGEQFLARNLTHFDAIFFFGVREIELTPEQRADLMSFVKEDGKGFVAAHSGRDGVLFLARVRRDAGRPVRRASLERHRRQGRGRGCGSFRRCRVSRRLSSCGTSTTS